MPRDSFPLDLSTLSPGDERRKDESRNGLDDAGPFVLLSGIDPMPVRWFWRGRIPLGKITVLDGDPGSGKSVLATDLAARLSVGRTFPDGHECEPAGSILLNAEDDPADTIRPRLDAAGGDPDKVLVLAGERHLNLSDDVEYIEGAIREIDAKLVVVDPLMAFFSPGVNTHKDAEVRQALVPVKGLAERTGAAIVLIRHLNKAGGVNPLYRGGGSI